MPQEVKTGPLTRAELQTIWESIVDKAYKEPLLEAGEGSGLEVWAMVWEVFARVSRAVDITTQALFITGYSGQTNPEAQGEAKATVTLTFTRSKLMHMPLILGAGFVFAEEQAVDWGENGGVDVLTGRRYVLTEDLVFHPGEAGPYDVVAEAEHPGYGYNNPMPGSIQAVDQTGENLNNEEASVAVVGPVGVVVPNVATVLVTSAPLADMFVPENVGQYVYFSQGANVAHVARIIGFVNPAAGEGSGIYVALDQSAQGTVFAGTFLPGEDLALGAFATARCLGERIDGVIKHLSWTVLRGDISLVVPGTVVTGTASGATLTITILDFPQVFINETDSATWRVLDWTEDFGLTVTNVESPTGGRAGFLDELGDERGINRSPNESDEVYRPRVLNVTDVVSPNALMRALSRTLGSIPWCFREVGLELLPGFFYDGNSAPVGGPQSVDLDDANMLDAYDTDVVLFTGTVTSGAFLFQEKVEVRDASLNVVGLGYHGRIDGGVTFTLIRKDGAFETGPATLTVHGLQSGAVFTATAANVPATVVARRFRREFQHADFRAFFLVGIPRLALNDFGMAYDDGDSNAYDDIAPFYNFYDGWAIGAATLARQVYDAMMATKAGGVGFDIYEEDIGCP